MTRFVHLSDIHFGQEKGGLVVTHDDVRERLIDDAAEMLGRLEACQIDGIIVSGDVAYAGLESEYSKAGEWLDRLATAVGCKITQIQVVPGNHDINRNELCKASELMLAEIAEKGELTLDGFLQLEQDRELFYGRFRSYRDFAEGYNCPLDREGGTAGERTVEVAPGHTLRFIGLNSALCCSKNDAKGKLLLGARQRVLPRRSREELVVICHHPLPWLRDSEEARQYVRSRARVFISGHEHQPQIAVDPIHSGCDLLTIAAGAATPPVADNEFTFSYNILEFELDAATSNLVVTVYPRVWSPEGTVFEANTRMFGAEKVQYTLGCPNYRTGPTLQGDEKPLSTLSTMEGGGTTKCVSPEPREAVQQEGMKVMEDKFPFLLLRFFRDLTALQRLTVLIELGALPKNWNGKLTHPVERRALDMLRANGQLDDLESKLQRILDVMPKENS